MDKWVITTLLNTEAFLLFEEYIKKEIQLNKDKAFNSIWTTEIDIESANRAKFYEECINIPRNLLKAKSMNTGKTSI